jgi:hypothetical protein
MAFFTEELVLYAREHSRETLGWVGMGWYTPGVRAFRLLGDIWGWCSLSFGVCLSLS